MKEITKWETEDGRFFDTMLAAHHHECMIHVAKELVALVLPPELNSDSFRNGCGFIKIKEETITRFIANYRRAIEHFHPEHLKTFDTGGPQGYIDRCLSENNSPLHKICRIAVCIDDNYRLWGQQYFRFHPDEGKQIQLNAEPI